MRGRGVHIVVISFMPVRAECAPLSLHRTLEWSFAPRVPARSRAHMRPLGANLTKGPVFSSVRRI